MKKYLLGVVIVGASAAVATPALAQDGGTFSGPRVEAVVGGVRDQNGELGRNTGVVYGVGVGYDVQKGSAVGGMEAEITDSTDDYCRYNQVAVGDSLCINPGRDIYVGLRAGSEISPGTLVYGKLGYTNSRTRFSYDGAVDTRDSVNLDGARIGAGVEHQFGTGTFAKAEYRYSNYENDASKHQLVVGVGLRF